MMRQHTKTFLKYLGNPQEDLKVLHVAGTNGKGSVCAYLDGNAPFGRKTDGAFYFSPSGEDQRADRH